MVKSVKIKEEYLAVVAVVILLVFGLIAGFSSDRVTSMAVKNTCHNGLNGAWNFCTSTCPCEANRGDCDGNDQCKIGLKCVDNFGPEVGLNSWVDVCVDYPIYLKWKEIQDKNREIIIMG